MNFITKINDKLKIIILTAYTLIAVLIVFLILNSNTEVKLLQDYSNVASDENVNLIVKIREDRKSSYGTNSDFESSTYYFGASLEKKETIKNAKLTNIRFLISGENKNGKISFDEYNSTFTISASSASGPSTTVNMSSSSKFKKTVVVENEKNVVTDKTPAVVYLTVLYDLQKDTSKDEITSHYIKYCVKLSQLGNVNFEQFESKKLVNNMIENDGNAIDIKVIPSYTSESSSKGNAKYDTITITPTLNNPFLSNREIKHYSIEAFGKVKNDVKDKENLFDDYIRVYTASGISLKNTNLKCDIDEKYDVSELYFIIKIELSDGSTQNLNYKVTL